MNLEGGAAATMSVAPPRGANWQPTSQAVAEAALERSICFASLRRHQQRAQPFQSCCSDYLGGDQQYLKVQGLAEAAVCFALVPVTS